MGIIFVWNLCKDTHEQEKKQKQKKQQQQQQIENERTIKNEQTNATYNFCTKFVTQENDQK